jgi:parallel beta-helix repeat protein
MLANFLTEIPDLAMSPTVSDAARINDEIKALSANGGGVVRLPPGVIWLANGASASSGCIVGLPNVELRGSGRGVTFLKLMNGQDVNFDVVGIVRTPSGVVTNNFTLADLTIDGNKANNSFVAAGGVTRRVIGFYCGVSPNNVLTDTDIVCRNVEIQNCSAYGFDPHERTTRLILDHCVAHDNTLDGFTIDGCYGGEATGCISYNNGRHGFNVITGSADMTFTGCHAYGNGSSGAVTQNSSKRIVFTGGAFRNNTQHGVRFDGAPQSAPAQDLTPGSSNKLTGAIISGNGLHGVFLMGISNCEIVGNTIIDNSGTTAGVSSGIYLDETGTNYSTGNAILANKVLSNTAGRHAFSIAEASANDVGNLIQANQVSGAVTNLRLFGTDADAQNVVSIATAARDAAAAGGGGGGAGYTLPDATATLKGGIVLAGDLSGSATAPTVSKVNGSALSQVAFSGSYADLLNKPTVGIDASVPYLVTRNDPAAPWKIGASNQDADFAGARARGQAVYFNAPIAAAPQFGTAVDQQHLWDTYLEFPAADFDPNSIPNLAYFWDPNVISAADGTAISTFAATVGGANLGEATPARQPTVQTLADGKRVIRMVWSGTAGTEQDLFATVTAMAQPFTMFIVHDVTGTTTTQQIVQAGAEVLIQSTGSLQAFAGSTLSLTGQTPPLALGVTVVVFNGTTSKMYRNGGTPAQGTTGTTALATTYRLGRHSSSGRPFAGNYGKNGIYQRVLTLAEINSLGQGLAASYASCAPWTAATV